MLPQKLEKVGEEAGNMEDWTDLLDHGGLYHVKETTFQLICCTSYSFSQQQKLSRINL